VSSDSGSLSTVDHTEVKCDYVRWKQEEFYSIKWSVQYPGVETSILQLWNDGRKSFPSNGIIDVDQDSVDEKKARIKVSSAFAEDDLNVCCEINVLHDDGYGSIGARKKSDCSPFHVERGQSPRHQDVPPELSLWTSHNMAVPGDQLEIHCSSREPHSSPSPPADFNIKVNGRRVTGQRSAGRLEARLALTGDHFSSARRRSGRRDWEDLSSDAVTVECEASVRGQVVANINKTIQRTQSAYPDLSPRMDLSRAPRVPGNTGSRHILVETKHTSGSVIIGVVPADVMESISPVRTHSRTRMEISDEPVEILDFLGTDGYKVVAMANTPDNRIVWTLAKTYIVGDEL